MDSTIAIYGIAFMCVVFIGVFNLVDAKAPPEVSDDQQRRDPKLN
jgi:hypothetical protein